MKSLFRFGLLIGLVHVLSYSAVLAQTPTRPYIYAPVAGHHIHQGVLEPSLSFGRYSLRSVAYWADDSNLGSAALASFAFPFVHIPNTGDESSLRASGWAWGAAMGVNQTAFIDNNFFSPSFYFYEAIVGRGSTHSIAENETGLRGYFELLYRNQRPLGSTLQNDLLSALNRDIRSQSHYMGLRIGAASDTDGKGIVEQKASKLDWSFQSALYVPLRDKQAYIDAQLRGLLRCFGASFRCGLDLKYFGLTQTEVKGISEDLKHGGLVSIATQYRWTPYFYNDFVLSWTILSSHTRTTMSKWPAAKLSLALGF